MLSAFKSGVIGSGEVVVMARVKVCSSCGGGGGVWGGRCCRFGLWWSEWLS